MVLEEKNSRFLQMQAFEPQQAPNTFIIDKKAQISVVFGCKTQI
jgi:hypothetical protein